MLCCASRANCRAMATQCLNIFMTMVGAGIVGLPFALGAASFAYGCASLVFALLFSTCSLVALTWLARAPLRQRSVSGVSGISSLSLLSFLSFLTAIPLVCTTKTRRRYGGTARIIIGTTSIIL
jgi:hypothetical protein